MKQVIQNYSTGRLELAEVPVPVCSADTVLVKNAASLVSIGTERSVIELAKKSLLGKAKARPDLVKRFIDKAKKEGYIKTFQEALGRLDNATPLGYSSAGVVIEVGANIHKYSPGDRVACIGAGYASHAEYITVPENLCCKIPDCMTLEEASFGMLGIIALHGVRSAKLTFGASVAVVGLGILGLLTIQILKAYGCLVIGTDLDEAKLQLAKNIGIEHILESGDKFVDAVKSQTDGFGCDAVIITAATKSDAPVNTAVEIAKQGARVVVVGVADIHPNRNEMWHKEIEVIVSKAGGPGVLDPIYENKGIDYPYGQVRWTQNRNLQEFLRLIAKNKVDVKSLISHKFPIEQAESAYQNVLNKTNGPYVGILLQYPSEDTEPLLQKSRSVKLENSITGNKALSTVGVIGAGLFGKAVLLPALKSVSNINLDTLATSSGANSYHVAKKYGFQECTTDYKEILSSNKIDFVLILTPHDLHAKMVIEALNAGKNVFVEKPLAVNESELFEIISARGKSAQPVLMVGYNRRFSPHSTKALQLLKNRKDPVVINYRVNSGYVPSDHWVHSQEQGGSRVIGEICHFIDLMQYLISAEPKKVYAERVSGNNKTILNSDNLAITFKFTDGSVGNIVYSASGDRAYSRENVEIFFDGKTINIDDFRYSRYYLGGKTKTFKTSGQQMGYKQELNHFFDVACGKIQPVLCDRDIFLSTLAVFKINESLESSKAIEINL